MKRSDIPEQMADCSTWPGVDPAALDAGRLSIYRQREGAIQAYLRGAPLGDLKQDFGINRGTLMRLLERCLASHPDGRIQGFRGLIPHARTKGYRRIAPAVRRTQRGGLTGALGQLFEQLPQLAQILEREIGAGTLGIAQSGRLYGLRNVQSKLVVACREAGLGAQAYPFSQDEMGYRSLARWVKRRLETRAPVRRHDSRERAWDATIRPFSEVELDGHKLDLRLRVRFTEPSGVSVDLETERLFVVTLIDVCTRIVLGWQVVPASEYNHHDVLAVLQDALRPRRKRDQLLITGLAYRPAAGFATEVCPEVSYACWDVLKVDNAAAHLSEETFLPACQFIGCRLEAGPVAQPTTRPFIERFFLTLTDRLSRQVVGTTGRHPQDPAGQRGRRVPVEQLITLPELEELLDVTIANYHATPHDGLNGRTPLEALQLAIAHQQTAVRTLPQVRRARLHQLQSVHLCTVRGNVARGVAPYISFYGARYSNEVLQRTSGLGGEKIRVYPNPADMREAWAYLSNGAELGRLAVLEGWRYSRHTLRLRKHILRLRRLGKLKFAGEQDPVHVFSDAQRRLRKRSRKQGTAVLQLSQQAPASGSEAALEATPQASAVPARRRQADAVVVPVDLGDLQVQNR
ncbi:DDE-type integrase/transposase/recombinase [Ralstonia solanacearum]|uniref:DDE-type integrase/transposase/recombinase n=1 Tax=Ralstonia solanacearum TaxID=305 RepID=UPI000AE5E7B8|nr:DDE-type integrase/transposase/recombinase [Ralstonia solanacearum]MDB0543486.1 DDE-type integrase/transposase/recombinase [Ralstonia solanacearum]MDB0553592.1 DDE-type integrase/transposase/recombinase [Ralstonia solanacearum]MDB0558437.1 DDE-type integrase/transposase/recombinase [Ralstonia solanacearum]